MDEKQTRCSSAASLCDQARETNVGYFAMAVVIAVIKTTILVVLSSLQIPFWVGPCLVPFKRVLDSVKALERTRFARR